MTTAGAKAMSTPVRSAVFTSVIIAAGAAITFKVMGFMKLVISSSSLEAPLKTPLSSKRERMMPHCPDSLWDLSHCRIPDIESRAITKKGGGKRRGTSVKSP
jgi:hypothetical protein